MIFFGSHNVAICDGEFKLYPPSCTLRMVSIPDDWGCITCAVYKAGIGGENNCNPNPSENLNSKL